MPPGGGGSAESATAKPAGFIEPMLAAPGAELGTRAGGPLSARAKHQGPAGGDGFGGGGWLFEPKLDGLRLIAVRNNTETHLWSRNGLSLNARFPDLVEAVLNLSVDNVVLDGEAVALVGGVADFAALHQGCADDVEYWVFDMPWLLGEDLRDLPLEQRKALLEQAVPEGRHLKLVRPVRGDPELLMERACREGWEGLVAKRLGSAYRGGRRPEWLKLKCSCRQELVIGGFTPPKGVRRGFGALLLGYWEQGRLVYAGKVGTGFSERTLGDLYEMLAQAQRPSSPFATAVPDKAARFVEPQLVAEVAFSNWTPDGRLRHPRFLALRTDKASSEVLREPCPDPRVPS
ncbi:MAG: non-homologous end-joining DNA ligase [Actinobacteria bacterium]|nr:non-homologous end-joining DNA ligase [Actinomycetota bacterium]